MERATILKKDNQAHPQIHQRELSDIIKDLEAIAPLLIQTVIWHTNRRSLTRAKTTKELSIERNKMMKQKNSKNRMKSNLQMALNNSKLVQIIPNKMNNTWVTVKKKENLN